MLCTYAVTVVSCVHVCQKQSNGVEVATMQLAEQTEACGERAHPQSFLMTSKAERNEGGSLCQLASTYAACLLSKVQETKETTFTENSEAQESTLTGHRGSKV